MALFTVSKPKVPIRALVGLLIIAASFLSAAPLHAQSVTKGYGSDQVLQRGMIVGLMKNSTDKVEAIDATRIKSILGVVVNPNDSPITISGNNRNIFVTITGRYDVLVSDQNGPIAKSDYITLSALSGVGMKASDQQEIIIGRTIGAFDGTQNILSTTTLKTVEDKEKVVHISRIPVEIAIGKSPIKVDESKAPIFLQRAGKVVSGKTVSALRLYLAMAIFIVGTVITGAILYAGIHSSIIAIGRNPLGKRTIVKSLIGVGVTSILVFLMSVLGVYLLLKL